MAPETLKALDKELQLGSEPWYEGFDHTIYGNSLEPGSMPADKLYEAWMKEYRPNIVIEVGSFLGYSAIGMAKAVKKFNLNTRIICIDSFTGSPEHWDFTKEKGDKRLAVKYGRSFLYEKFISNVIYADVKDVIIPFPYPSATAAAILTKVFDKLNVKADMAFIDGDHSALGVYLDLNHYMPLLKDGGYCWGDDFAWESVRFGVGNYLEENNLQQSFNLLPNRVHWSILKPTATAMAAEQLEQNYRETSK